MPIGVIKYSNRNNGTELAFMIYYNCGELEYR